jgi:hypothetical protein
VTTLRSLTGLPLTRERRWLGFAGLLPFLACMIVLLTAGDLSVRQVAAQTMQHYAAIIASFLGAVHWGIAAATDDATQSARLRWGITPALISWALLALPGQAALLGYATLFILILAVDLYLLPALDADYRALRRPLTAVVVATLLIAALVAPETGGAAV